MATKDEIKDSAYYCFAHYGYEGTTMQDIAKAVGLKKQSLYSHFESKEELYQIVLQEQRRQIAGELIACYSRLKGKPPEELLQGIFKCCVAIFSDRERLLLWKRTLIHSSTDDGHVTGLAGPEIWHFDMADDSVYEDVKSLYPALADRTTFQTLFISYMLMIQGYLDWMMLKGFDPDSWQMVWTNFWDGAESLFLRETN
jgi:AcrR family transcriptional regulator